MGIGIPETTIFPFEVYTHSNTLTIKQAEGQTVSVFDVVGRCIFQTIANDEVTYTLPTAGLYVVKIGERFTKKIVSQSF